MKKYSAPKLFIDTFVADTMIASSNPKNGNADNNQNCWGCYSGSQNNANGDACCYVQGTQAFSWAGCK